MTEPFLTVLSGAGNCAGVASRCIESVLRQKFQDWEMFYVVDAATDATYDVAKEAVGGDPRVTVLYNAKRQCYVRHFQRLSNTMRGSVMILLGGDDYLYSSDALSVIADYYTVDNELDATLGSFLHIAPGRAERALLPFMTIGKRGSRLSGLGNNFHPHPMTMRLSMLRDALRLFPDGFVSPTTGNPYEWSADLALYRPVLVYARKVLQLPEMLYVYEWASADYDSSHLADQQREAQEIYDCWVSHEKEFL